MIDRRRGRTQGGDARVRVQADLQPVLFDQETNVEEVFSALAEVGGVHHEFKEVHPAVVHDVIVAFELAFLRGG